MKWSDYYAEAKENWRILLLGLFLVVSALSVAPGAEATGPTNLEYGLELSGGAQIRAPLEGQVVRDVDYSGGADGAEVEATVASELGVEQTEVRAKRGAGAFEVYDENVSQAEIAAAMRAAGFADVTEADVEEGLTESTYEDAEGVITRKLSESPEFTGSRVNIQQTPTGDQFLKIEVPGATREAVLETINERGLVEIVAIYPEETDNGTVYRNETLFTQESLSNVGTIRQGDAGQWSVPITLTPDAADTFAQRMREFGFAQQGGVDCFYDQSREQPGHCLVVYKDGEYVNSFGMQESLSSSMREDSFDGGFQMTTGTGSDAESAASEVRIAMEAGALPTNLDVDEGDSKTIGAAYAQDLKLFSLITGIIAALAVAVVVFIRYGEPRVAAPMVVTALAEVFILLGFASAIGLALDLSHIAGFIAVVGTGVDDLVIIADEVLNQGEVSTRRVFQNRFKKAFWVIGVAAVTTIIAMAPLTVLSLGDLTGFAMVTIVGVLIGVLVTRPAYGDVLRSLMTTEES
jgi:preprotein translocase subunit SecD